MPAAASERRVIYYRNVILLLIYVIIICVSTLLTPYYSFLTPYPYMRLGRNCWLGERRVRCPHSMYPEGIAYAYIGCRWAVVGLLLGRDVRLHRGPWERRVGCPHSMYSEFLVRAPPSPSPSPLRALAACTCLLPHLYRVMPCTHLGSSTTPPSTRALRTGARGRTVAVGV